MTDALPDAPSTDEGGVPRADQIRFLLEAAEALHVAGTPAHRLEGALGQLSERLGVKASFFSTPTIIQVSVGPEHAPRTYLRRVDPGGLDLGRLSAVDRLVDDVAERRIGVREGAERLRAIMAAGSPYPEALDVLAFAATGGSASILLGGEVADGVAGLAVGTLVGLLALVAPRWPRLGSLFEPGVVLMATLASAAWAGWIDAIDPAVVTVASVIVLLPGLSLTTGFTELSTRNLVSGTARVAAALLVFLGMAVGAVLGARLSAGFPEATALSWPVRPGWTTWPIVVVAGLSLAELLRVRLAEAPWVVVSCLLAVAGTLLGDGLVGSPLAGGVAAVCVTAGSNLVARWRDQATAVMIVPGVLLLVPGSVGFRALAALTDHRIVEGIELAVTAGLSATAIAGGVLAGNLLVPPRRAL